MTPATIFLTLSLIAMIGLLAGKVAGMFTEQQIREAIEAGAWEYDHSPNGQIDFNKIINQIKQSK